MKKVLMITLCCFLSISGFSQKFFKFKTTEVDVEYGSNTVTKYETHYHTIDYGKKQIIYEGTSAKGEKIKITYPMTSFYEEGITSVIVVNSKGLKEFWFSSVAQNLGYDMEDGTRLAFYKLTLLERK